MVHLLFLESCPGNGAMHRMVGGLRMGKRMETDMHKLVKANLCAKKKAFPPASASMGYCRLVVLDRKHDVTCRTHGIPQRVLRKRLFHPHGCLAGAEVHLCPNAVQLVERIFHAPYTVGTGHAVDGQHRLIWVVGFIPVRYLNLLDRSFVLAATTAPITEFPDVAVNSVDTGQRQ